MSDSVNTDGRIPLDSFGLSQYTIAMADSFETRIIRRRTLPFLEVKTGADKTYAVRRHSHNTLSVGFVEEGSSLILCDPLEFYLSTGDAVLIPPKTIHLCQPAVPERFKFRMLHLCPDWLAKTLGIAADKLVSQSVRLSDSQQRAAADFFAALQSVEDRFLNETNAILFVGLLFSRVFLKSPATEDTDQTKDTDQPSDPQPDLNRDMSQSIRQVKEFLDENFDRDIQLDDLVDISGIDKYTLLRQFKDQWQITPHAYLINCRINAAKAMLKKGQSVADTAVACGFFDQSHFIKTFKNFVGIRPADYPG